MLQPSGQLQSPKITTETLEQDVKYVQSLQQRHQSDAYGVVLVS